MQGGFLVSAWCYKLFQLVNMHVVCMYSSFFFVQRYIKFGFNLINIFSYNDHYKEVTFHRRP
jgi:hypothetical protein